jgi:ABC-type sugar transport system substrate-binding protein
MKKLRFVISLPNDNRYQHEQGLAALAAGERLGVDVRLMHANDDAITQSQQILEVVQARPEARPDAVVAEPVTGSGLRRVAQTAVAAGIGWVISNCDVDYVAELRRSTAALVFAVSQGQMEVGRLQGKQIAALLPGGGAVLSVEGPSASVVAVQRHEGVQRTKPPNVQIRSVRTKWSEESSYLAVSSWLRLATNQAEHFRLLAAQAHDLMLGARRAFEDHPDPAEREKWLGLPSIGVGIRTHVEPLIARGTMTAAVITAVTMPLAVEMLHRAIETKSRPPEHTMVELTSCPALAKLAESEKILQRQ